MLEGEEGASIEPLEHGQAPATYDKLLEHAKYNLDYLKENYPEQADPYEGSKERNSELAHEVHDSLEKLREKGLIRDPALDYPLGEEKAVDEDDELLMAVLSMTDKPDVSTKSYHLITQIDEDDVFGIDWHYYELRYRGAAVHPKFSLGGILCFAEMADGTVIEFHVSGIAELYAKFCKIVDDYLDEESTN